MNRGGLRAKILASQEAWGATDAADNLVLLNAMMAGFGPRGIHYAHVTLGATDTVNMPDEQIDNLVTMFAEKLCDEYGVVIDARMAGNIARAEKELQAAYYTVPLAKINRGLLRNRYGFFNITRGY